MIMEITHPTYDPTKSIENAMVMKRAMGMCSPIEMQVLSMNLDGYTLTELAGIMGCAVATATARRNRGIHHLRKALHQLGFKSPNRFLGVEEEEISPAELFSTKIDNRFGLSSYRYNANMIVSLDCSITSSTVCDIDMIIELDETEYPSYITDCMDDLRKLANRVGVVINPTITNIYVGPTIDQLCDAHDMNDAFDHDREKERLTRPLTIWETIEGHKILHPTRGHRLID